MKNIQNREIKSKIHIQLTFSATFLGDGMMHF